MGDRVRLMAIVGPAVLIAAVQIAAPTAVHAKATPASAANGLFLWTDGASGLVNAIPSPDREKCFGTFKANRAQNWTDSDAVISRDGLCFDVLTVVKAGQSYDGEFGSVGFTPPGATHS